MNIVLTVMATLIVAAIARSVWLRYFPPGYAIGYLTHYPRVYRGEGPGVLSVAFEGEVEPVELVTKPGMLTVTLSAAEATAFIHSLLWVVTKPPNPGDERPVTVALQTWQAEWLIERLEKFGAGWAVEDEVSRALYMALGKAVPTRW